MNGIVLARDSYKESDQRVSILTKQYGKKIYTAKGVKKITSKNSAALGLGNVVNIGVVAGKETAYITTVQVINPFFASTHSLPILFSVQHVLVILNRILGADQPDMRLYTFMLHWLDFLQNHSDFCPHAVYHFYVHFLDILGYTFNIPPRITDSSSDSLAQVYVYNFADGLFQKKDTLSASAERCHGLSGAAISYLHNLSIGNFLAYSSAIQSELGDFLHEALVYYTEKPQHRWDPLFCLVD
tara:strand:+ start:616 stop:1341 length:726 start_codon:yes stop_codon:yes gene_type:complete